MKHYRYLFGLALLVVGTMPAFSQVSNDNEDEVYKIDARARQNDFVPGQVLVKFKDESPVNVSRTRGMFRSTNNGAVDAVLKEFGVETMDKLLPNAKPLKARRKSRAFNGELIEEKDLSQIYLVKTKPLRKDSTMMLVSKLKELGEVEFAEPNYKIYMMGQMPNAMPENPAIQAKPSKPYSTRSGDEVICANPGQNPLYEQQWGIKHLKINELWNKPVVNKKRPVIAILDTGVDITHPDLVDNIWTKEGTEDEHGYDFINETYNIRDYNMHGTHVAGIAAACNNETGIVGANPQALIMPITVMQSDGTGDVQVLVKGIQYAIDNGADVINMSLGTYANSYALRQVLEHAYQNSILVASAGNDAIPLSECGRATMYPAGYAFVLGVQSGKDGVLDGFSNSDCNGPTYSELNLDNQENYELIAPGTGIVSSIPYGNYKSLNGTSMSAPLVAGGISALKMVKDYNTQEILWGDLIHMDCDFLKTFEVEERPAVIEVITLKWNDYEDDGNGDRYFDAGETVRFYPVVRTVWGEASNVKCHLEIGDEYEDASLIEIIQNDAELGWNLSAYAYETFKEPIIFKISENCADARHIKLKLTVTCDEAINSVTQEFVISVDNVIKLGGYISSDMTLDAKHKYLVSNDAAVLDGVTLVIEPGAKIVIRNGKKLSVFGNLTANGEPNKQITFIGESLNQEGGKAIFELFNETRLTYCNFNNISVTDKSYSCFLENCIIENAYVPIHGEKCNILNTEFNDLNYFKYSNFVNNTITQFAWSISCPRWSLIDTSNYFNTMWRSSSEDNDQAYWVLGFYSSTPRVDYNEHPGYLGTARADLVIPHIRQMGYQWDDDLTSTVGNGYGTTDLSNMLTEPVYEAHGIIWKVLVDGVDPQDEYEIMPTLGVGKHKFEVYFNRPMNKAVIPNVAFGVRPPYSQNAVDEEGSWNEEGTIYTAYKTITGKTQSDGRNRIYVWGAEDDEFFECPYENWRFNIDIQSAGSQSAGFMGEAGLGRVELEWNELKTDMKDVLGFNVYRYTTTPDDSVRVNDVTIDAAETHFTDYDIVPGTTYYYKYKVQSTDLKEYQPSNVVAVTPLTAKLGDVTGNNEVDVFDIVYEVNYILGKKPKAFVKCAADVNGDKEINVLDVQGIVNTILDPSAASRTRGEDAASAVYSIEDGILYVESPVALGGVQVQVNVLKNTEITTLDDLKGFEQAGAWLSKNDYLFMAYNMKGKTLAAGKHALLRIGDGQVKSITVGDAKGMKVSVSAGSGTTAIDNMATAVKKQEGIYNLKGQKVAGSADEFSKLPKGIYIVNGTKVMK